MTTSSRVGNADEQADRLNSELPCATRRALLLTAFTGYAILAAIESTKAEEESGSRRPQKADLLVRAEGDHAGEVIRLDDLRQGDAPLHAWPKDPKTSVVRDGSRLNEVMIVKLDPEELDEVARNSGGRPRCLFCDLHPRWVPYHRVGEAAGR